MEENMGLREVLLLLLFKMGNKCLEIDENDLIWYGIFWVYVRKKW